MIESWDKDYFKNNSFPEFEEIGKHGTKTNTYIHLHSRALYRGKNEKVEKNFVKSI